MRELTNDDFIGFIEYYKEKTYEDENHKIHKCYDTVTELSRSDTKRGDSLVNHPQKMYGLDWIVKSSKKLNKKPTKSTDALFIREDDGNLELHIIEFKFIGKKSQRDKMNILWYDIKSKISCEDDIAEDEECFDDFFVNDFKLIRKNFHDPVEVSLQLKPYEVIFITLPELYYEYCENENIPKKDIKTYLTKINKYYWAFVGNFSKDEYNIKSKTNRYNEYNKRLERTIFKKAKAKPWQRFEGTLEHEILKNNVD